MRPAGGKSLKMRLQNNWQLYAMLLIPIILTIIYKYIPMYGIQIAFRDYKASRGMFGSEWVGLKWFARFFGAPNCVRMLKNTLLLSLYSLLWSFPIPIILALMLNQVRFQKFKRATQTVLYAPHFISTMVICGMIRIFLSPSGGLINLLLGSSVDFLTEASAFRTIYIASGIWQDAGWGIIVYMATLSNIDTSLYEAAKVDGDPKTPALYRREEHMKAQTETLKPSGFSERTSDIILVAVCAVILLIVAYPLYYVLIASVSNPYDVYAGKTFLLPSQFTLDGYKAVFADPSILSGLLNSFKYTIVGTVFSVVMLYFTAYPLSVRDLPGRKFFSIFFIITMYFGGGLVPTYLIVKETGLIGSMWALFLPGGVAVGNMIIMRNFFENSIPKEMIEAAEIDGASKWTTFLRIVVPLSRSIMAVMRS